MRTFRWALIQEVWYPYEQGNSDTVLTYTEGGQGIDPKDSHVTGEHFIQQRNARECQQIPKAEEERKDSPHSHQTLLTPGLQTSYPELFDDQFSFHANWCFLLCYSLGKKVLNSAWY